ncbi:MAG: phage tail protein [Deltaproteobacteria bacterium]|nr:phage tail protein [Deltaproteobacteria bacterium]MBW2448230.1 phage tail protein [Deltaproteobacteria bacterium]
MSTRSTLFSILLALAAAGFLSTSADAAKEKFVRDKPHVNVGVISSDLDMGGFIAMSGLGVEIEVVEVPGSPRKIPGRTTYSDITLKRGYTGATDVHDWATEGLRGEIQLRAFSVQLLTPSAEPVSEFHLVECFPTRWDLSTDDKGHAIETIVVKCGRVELAR